ncbi:hypothetical protein Barb7_01485 [Bacteroidales bacterium Barb7]|nr:hypothetical protein Barb7_01485 [Bacteroidales bacterium Barb7]
MIHPFLNAPLHTHLLHPVHIVGSRFEVRRAGDKFVRFRLRVMLDDGMTVGLHPRDKLMMENDILFVGVARFVHIVHTCGSIGRIDLAAAFVNGEEDRLNARCGLRHQAGRPRRRNCKAGNVAPSVGFHILVKNRVSLAETVDKGVFLLAHGIKQFKGTALFSHLNGSTVGGKSQHTLNVFGTVCRLVRPVAQTESGNHIAFGSNAHTRAASLQRFLLNLLPQMPFGRFHFILFGVGINLVKYLLNLFRFEVNNIIHDTLGKSNMLLEKVVIKIRLSRKRFHHIRIQIDCQQPATVIRTERNLPARIGGYRAKAQICIHIRHRLL